MLRRMKVVAVRTEPHPVDGHEHVVAVKFEDDTTMTADDVMDKIRGGERFHMVGMGGKRALRIEHCRRCHEDALWA